MSSHLSKDSQSNKRLSSLRAIHSGELVNLEFTKQTQARKKRLLQQKRINILHHAAIKMKTIKMVRLFIEKLRRNIIQKKPQQYDVIQHQVVRKRKRQQYYKPFDLYQPIKALLMALNTISLLLVQVIAVLQGFYPNYQQQSPMPVAVTTTLKSIALGVFASKIFVSMTNVRIASPVRQKYMREVAYNYIFSIIFILDFMNLLMIILRIVLPDNAAINNISFIVSLISIPVISQNLQVIQFIYVNNFMKRQYFSAFKILIFNVFFVQFVSAVMYAMSFFDTSNNWITKSQNNGNIQPHAPWWMIYVYSIYWAITTLVTVGYGDLTPANYFQAIILTLVMFFGTVVLSYNISQIGNIVSNLRSVNQRRIQQTIIFKRLSSDAKLSQQLQDKVLNYIQRSSQIREQFGYDQQKQFLQNIPDRLSDQIQAQHSLQIFSTIPFFKSLNRQTLISLAMKLKGEIYYPGEYLTLIPIKFPKIMFLRDGIVGFAYYRQKSNINGLVIQNRSISKHRDTPYMLNKYLLTQDRQIKYQIVAQSYCFLLVLEFEDLQSIVRSNKKDNQYYFYTYHKVSFIDQQLDTFECKHCAPKRHTLFVCPKLHYIPFKSMVLHREIFGKSQFQHGLRRLLRQATPLRKVHTLTMWKRCFKHYQLRWQIEYHKSIKRRIAADLARQSAYDPADDSRQLTLNQWAQKISRKVLENHCCKFTIIQPFEKQFEIDQMHDFDYFFPQHNPSNLSVSLKKKKPQIYLSSGQQSRSQYQSSSDIHSNINKRWKPMQ